MGVTRLTTDTGSIPEEISGGEAGVVFGDGTVEEGIVVNDSEQITAAPVARKSDIVPRNTEEMRLLKAIQPMRPTPTNDVDVFVHEINQQLAVAMMAESGLERFIKNASPGNPEQVKSLLDLMKTSLETMKDLVKELKENTKKKVDSATEVVDGMKPINISEFLESLVAGWHQLFDDQAKITSDIDPGIVVLVNKRALHEILHNVFMNAVEICEKKGGSHPEIHIQARVFRDLAQVIVQDNGPGITGDDKIKLLTPGFTTKDGHGIGIIRCDQLIHGMHGDWDLINNAERDDLEESVRPKTGATFVVEFPLCVSE
jgi:signal transduction histidine kinase